MKKSFILYTDQVNIIEALTDEQAGKLLKGFYNYQMGKDPELDPILNLVFLAFKNSFTRDGIKWNEERKARRIAGRLGGLKRVENERNQAMLRTKSKQIKQSQANQAVSVSVSVSDSKLAADAVDKIISSKSNAELVDGKLYVGGKLIKFPIPYWKKIQENDPQITPAPIKPAKDMSDAELTEYFKGKEIGKTEGIPQEYVYEALERKIL